MIKVSHMVPPKYFRLQDQVSQCYLVLAHELERNKEYYDAIMHRDYKKFMLLDNSAYEVGESADCSSLIQLAKDLSPDAIVLPDVMYDMEATIERTEDFLSKTHTTKYFEQERPRLMGVPQGRTLEEWLECFCHFYRDPRIHWIGISFLVVERCFSSTTRTSGVYPNRLFCLRMLSSLGLTDKPVHLLGLGDPAELREYREMSFVKSCDSSVAFQAAVKGEEITEEGYDRREFKKVDFNATLIDESLFLRNASIINLFAGQGFNRKILEGE